MHLRKLFQKPPRYVSASILCSIGGFLFGVDTGIIGPVTVMKSFTSTFGSQSATIHGLVVSAILIPAAISSFFGGKLADWLGRPQAIGIGAFIYALGAAIEAGAVSIGMFVAGRCLAGIGEGFYLGILVVYICEISPPSKRGRLTTTPQLVNTFGLVVGFFVCYGSTYIESSLSWRTPYIILCCMSMMYAVATVLWLVPSPRWLTLRGRRKEASEAWDILGVSHAEREKAEDEVEEQAVVIEIHNVIDPIDPKATTTTTITKNPTEAKFFELFAKDVRSRTILAIFMMSMQQLSGIDGVLYYAPLLFQQAGFASTQASFLASGVSAIMIFVFTIPALLWADTWGRRHSIIYGGLGMTITMFMMGGLYAGNAVHGSTGAGRWVVIICIYLFAITFAMSWAVGVKLYVAEIQPQRTRASATSVAHGSNWATNFLVALTTPVLLQRSSFAPYFLFGGCTLITAIACWIFMPETKGRSLDEIEASFNQGHNVFSQKLGAVFKRGNKNMAQQPSSSNLP